MCSGVEGEVLPGWEFSSCRVPLKSLSDLACNHLGKEGFERRAYKESR